MMAQSPTIAERSRILSFIFVGMLISIYLGLFQLHVFRSVWDPLFVEGSIRVLDSPLSRALPVPDSLIGALGYFSEAVALIIGSKLRFGRGSWILFLYSIIALAMGVVSVGLVFYQAFAVHDWCTLCISSALISMGLSYPGLRELKFGLRAVKEEKTDAKTAA
jgi:uncharacterized membrane protein